MLMIRQHCLDNVNALCTEFDKVSKLFILTGLDKGLPVLGQLEYLTYHLLKAPINFPEAIKCYPR